MTKKLKHNLLTILLYSIIFYILLIPLKIWIISIGISLILGFFGGILNDILTQLRIINGEKFHNLEEPKDELIKG